MHVRPPRLITRSFAPAATVVALATMTSIAPAASAHDTLTGSYPTPGSSMKTAPAAVTLTFSEPVLDLGDQISIKAPNGSTTANPPTVSGATLTVPFKAAGSGTYVVTWRVTSADGHPVSGQFDFSLAQGGGSASTSALSSAPTSASTTAGAPAPASSDATVKGPTTPTTDEPGDNHTRLVVAGAIVGALALAGAFVVARRRTSDDPR